MAIAISPLAALALAACAFLLFAMSGCQQRSLPSAEGASDGATPSEEESKDENSLLEPSEDELSSSEEDHTDSMISKEKIFTAIEGALCSGLSGEAGQGAAKGEPIKYNKTTWEDYRGGSPSSYQYHILNNELAYTDSDGLRCFQKNLGISDETNDYYCVAMSKGEEADV